MPRPGESGANQIAERHINAVVMQRSLAHYRSLFINSLKHSYPVTAVLPQAQQLSIADDDMILHLCWRRRAVNPSHYSYAFLVVAYAGLVDYSAPLTQTTMQCVVRPFSAPPNYKIAEWVWVRDYAYGACTATLWKILPAEALWKTADSVTRRLDSMTHNINLVDTIEAYSMVTDLWLWQSHCTSDLDQNNTISVF